MIQVYPYTQLHYHYSYTLSDSDNAYDNAMYSMCVCQLLALDLMNSYLVYIYITYIIAYTVDKLFGKE